MTRLLGLPHIEINIAGKVRPTNLYNQRPTWLDYAHRAVDEAVAAAYGWPADVSDEEVLRRLLALNRERTGP